MTWTAITTLTRRWLNKSAATLIGVAAALILISDFVVAFKIFLPVFDNSSARFEDLVRGTFKLAWSI